MNPSSKLRKIKNRRIVVISASKVQGGIQSLYIVNNGNWEIISHSFIPYPSKVATLLQKADQCGQISLSDLSWLDYKLSTLFVEATKAVLMQVPTVQRTPHYIVLNKPTLYQGPTGETAQQSSWDIPLGDAQFLAVSYNTLVLTDLIRHHIIAGGKGVIPTNQGDQIIASRCSGIAVFLNIGILSRMTIIDPTTSSTIIDSDTGPGTLLLDKLINDNTGTDQFDRDGTFASGGNIDGNCLNLLASDDWFQQTAPKSADPQFLYKLLDIDAFRLLSKKDQAATLTALSARTAYDFYKREYRSNALPQTIYVSGGGANNLTLMEYLSTYFSPVPVQSIETIGVPSELRVPLSLGLTVDSFVTGSSAVSWETGNFPRIEPLGRWVLP